MKRTLLAAFLTGQALAQQPGLQFEEVPETESRPQPTSSARTLPLNLAELSQLLARLPALKSQPGEIQPFVLRQSAPPPKTGQRLEQPFPAPPQAPPPKVEMGPVRVLSYSPQGEVELAPQVSLTFNQPMPPDRRPAKITPQPEGEWRWVGSQTLVFQPSKRLPMASQFQVEVEALKWTFTTPPPHLKISYPNRGKTNLRPVIFLEFNQRIDTKRAIDFVKLNGSTLRPARPEEIAADKQVQELVKAAQPETWLALIPVEPLDRGTLFTVSILPGLPSLEGPRATEESQEFAFHTYSPLEVDGPPPEEPPGYAVPISFSNDLAEQEVQVSAQPEVPGLTTRIYNGNLYLYGRTHGRSQYKLTLPAGIRDVFGQQTAAPITLDWKTGQAIPRFNPPHKDFLLLDPTGPPELSFEVINHPRLWVQVRAVKISEYEAYRVGPRHGDIPGKVKLPGEVIQEQEIDTGGQPDKPYTVKLNLNEALKKSDQLLVIAMPRGAKNESRQRAYHGWVQRTNLGVNLATDGKKTLAWISNLSDGRPLAGAQVSYLGSKTTAQTDADGLATLPYEADNRSLLVQHGKDQLFWPKTGRHNSREHDATLWSVHDDRRIYKPGETVSVKGWLRREIHQAHGGLELPVERSLSYELRDRNRVSLAKGSCPIERLGGFHFQVKLPTKVELGSADFTLSAGSERTAHAIDIQEFRAPEFEVTARNASPSALIGGIGSLSVDANYFAGGGLKNAPVRWDVEATPSSYHPPHWEDYTFDTWRPWWNFAGWRDPDSTRVRKSFQGVTDARGKDILDLKFLSAEEPRPYSLLAAATLSDANRQSWSSSTTMLVHPAQVYVGLNAKRTFVQEGQPLEYQLVVTDLDGQTVVGRPVVVKVRNEQKREIFSRQLTSVAKPLELSIPLKESGVFTVEATVSDEQNRSNRCTVTSWVAGGEPPKPSRNLDMERLILVPDKKLYQPGDTAEILIMAPFAEGRALVTLERHGLVSHQFLTLAQGSAILKVPLDPDFLPNLNVTVDAVGKAPRGSNIPDRPAQARAGLNLAISPASRELQVEVRPDQTGVLPGTSNGLQVSLKDFQGKPVAQSDVALLVVDEAVLALSGHDFRNPFADFYPDRPGDVEHDQVRDLVDLARIEDFPLPQGAYASATGAAGATNVTFTENYRGITGRGLSGETGPFEIIGNRLSGIGAFQGAQALIGAQAFPIDVAVQRIPLLGDLPIYGTLFRKTTFGKNEKIRLRKDFSPLAFYLPNARTNAAGQIHAPFKLPDNLTRYRVVALAAGAGHLFGKGESSLVARQPLMIRPSAPRFLNLGDRCELPLLVQNQTDKPMEVALACRAINLQLDPARAGVRFTVPANDRLEVRFPVRADQAGTARLQFAVSSADFADASNAVIPVLTPATTEATATYGTVDDGAVAQPVIPPKDVFPDYGGLEVSTSSTALSELTDAFLYLRKYPHECSEQISSCVLSTVALEPVLRAFQSKDLPTPEELKRSLTADIQKLKLQQNDDGGWDYWRRYSPSVPWVSLHVTHTLVRLRQAGHQVSDDCYERALEYVSSIDKHIPEDYPKECRPPLQAYALYTLNRAGRPDPRRARQLLEDWGGVEKTPLECLGWILPTLSKQPEAEAIRRHLTNRVSQTAATAEFVTNYHDNGHLVLSSNRRDDAVLLEALIQDSPQSPLLPKLVRGLLAARIAGRWESTQENCFALLALNEYFHKFEKESPDFVAHLWLGERAAGEQAFRGRSADSKELRVPVPQLDGPTQMIFSKEGPGRLYYRLGLKYAPLSLQLPALERGFTVQRTYEATEDNRDVVHGVDGRWHIKAGARVKVTVSMANPFTRYQVALVDPLPAGLEAINPALQGSQKPPQGKRKWWSRYWFDHENMRDDRVEAFTSYLHGGFHTYSYYARATTPGQFIAPPAKAEEMYHPETFGRSATDQVTIDP